MEATTIGHNRTGTAMSPIDVKAMTEAADALSPAMPIDTTAMDAERMTYINDADAVGSIPPPASMKGMLKAGMAKIKGGAPSLFMDKIGERIAFERAGTRLYEALITKYEAVQGLGTEALSPADRLPAADGAAAPGSVPGETPMQTLQRIRMEELQHFRMLCEAMQKMGGDPTAQTPSADVTGVESLGLVQVLNDPRTSLAQSLHALLTVELADRAGWETLIALAGEANQDDLVAGFTLALEDEHRHLVLVQGWYHEAIGLTPIPGMLPPGGSAGLPPDSTTAPTTSPDVTTPGPGADI